MKKLLIGSIAILAIAIGCAPGKSVVGTWNVKSEDVPPGSTMTATFENGDGMTMDMNMSQDLPGGKKMTLIGKVKGTYKIEGDYISLKADDVSFTGQGIPKELETQFNASMDTLEKDLKDQLNKEGKAKFAWVDDNTFTITGAKGKPETFTRAK